MNFFQPAFLKKILSIIALETLVIVIYQPCALDYARQDHLRYIKERVYFPDDGQWLLHSISYNRTRLNAPGDYFLFRPGLHCFLALNDIYFRDHQLVTGILSIFLHFLVALLLFAILKKCFPSVSAFLFAALFASQYPGLEMVAWRHISFYMVSVIFVLTSFLIIASKTRQYNLILSILMAEGMLFHEVIPSSIFLLAIILIPAIVFSHRKKINKTILIPRLIYILGGALVIYFVLDSIDWAITTPPSLLGPDDHFPKNLAPVMQNFLLYLGAGTRAVFNPFSVPLVWHSDQFLWIITQSDMRGLFFWATGGLGTLLGTIYISLRQIFRHKEKVQDLLSLWACCGVIALTAIFSFVRATMRSQHYLETKIYNYWFFSFFYIIIIAYLVNKALEKIFLPPRWRSAILLGGYVFLSGIILEQTWMARNTIMENYNSAQAQQIQEAILTGKGYFALNPSACMDPESEIRSSIRTIAAYLNKYNCDRRPGLSVVHPVLLKDGSIQFELGPYDPFRSHKRLLIK